MLDGDQESLADSGDVDAVTGSLGDAEFLSLSTGDGVRCAPAQVRPADLEGSGLDALETPEQVAFAITGEGSVAASVTDTFAFADAETAEADAEARQTYLDEGTSLKTREPIADLLDGVEVTLGAGGDGGLHVQRRRRAGPAHAAQPGRGLGLQPGLTLSPR